ncbi:hypothetical protein [Bradyrhizobium sp. BR 10289]|uniref:hypothetical protein n=1 Tax=Bradyrhizobium sp. BR 10289 TaxID=2749993 RepID=UPI001C64DE4E|nr:hypothetical protein [Bradyrhizobium sp. BR 10289]MBW7971489.1 hypothetical protein [Bradyrhizobium sp. BR 10289]
MLRTRVCLAAMLLATIVHAASAQTTAPAAPAPAATTEAKPGKIKLTMQKLKDMKAKWAANKPKLKACRADVKSKGLIGDDRWFYIEECMNKT